VRKSFIEQGISTTSKNLGGRRVAYLSLAEEEAFLDSFNLNSSVDKDENREYREKTIS
jgi:hypothetical protein